MKVSLNVLSEQSITDTISQIENYKKDLARKCEKLVSSLANRGIEVAKGNVGNFGHYIAFKTVLEPNTTGCKAIVIATETGVIKSQWKTKDGIQEADVSPLLMAEFGSGFKTENPKNIPDVGQGTFPDQHHAFDANGWYYQDLNDVWHHTTGIAPTMPMYKASLEIIAIINTVARGVFT